MLPKMLVGEFKGEVSSPPLPPPFPISFKVPNSPESFVLGTWVVWTYLDNRDAGANTVF